MNIFDGEIVTGGDYLCSFLAQGMSGERHLHHLDEVKPPLSWPIYHLAEETL